jgi:hypothetical protein
VSVKWFANPASGMSRNYLENARAEADSWINTAPTGVAVFADDFQTIRMFAERDNSNIEHWIRFDDGGRFAALESATTSSSVTSARSLRLCAAEPARSLPGRCPCSCAERAHGRIGRCGPE